MWAGNKFKRKDKSVWINLTLKWQDTGKLRQPPWKLGAAEASGLEHQANSLFFWPLFSKCMRLWINSHIMFKMPLGWKGLSAKHLQKIMAGEKAGLQRRDIWNRNHVANFQSCFCKRQTSSDLNWKRIKEKLKSFLFPLVNLVLYGLEGSLAYAEETDLENSQRQKGQSSGLVCQSSCALDCNKQSWLWIWLRDTLQSLRENTRVVFFFF